jgi:hypothetical protein
MADVDARARRGATMTDVTRKATLTQEHDNERVSAWTRRYASPRAPVAQWIEQRFPKPRA